MPQPTFPKYNSLNGRALALLLVGEKFTHRDFQNKTASYRLSEHIRQLRDHHRWTILTIEETAQTSDPTGRIATYGRYSIDRDILLKFRNEMGDKIDAFVKAVKNFEQGGGNRPAKKQLSQPDKLTQSTV